MSQWTIKEVAYSVPFDNDTNGYIADNVQDAIEETKVTAGQSRYAVLFGYNGNASNRWLQLFQSVGSDDTPFVVAEPSEIVSLSLSNKNTTSATVTIYKNGISVDTISIVTEKTGYESGLSIALAAGDTVSAKVTTGAVGDPICSVNIKVTA